MREYGEMAAGAVTLRAHPFMIFAYLKPYLFVLLLPVLRGLLSYGSSGVLSRLVVGEAVLALAIVTVSVLNGCAAD